MGFWDNFSGALFGRAPKTVDPYEQDRSVRMQALQGAMGDYDRMLSTPGGAIPPAYRDQMLGEVERDVRNMNPGAGQSGFVNDRVSRARNDMRMKMLDTELGQLNKQRDYMSGLTNMSQPTQQLPGQTGMVQQAGSDLMGRAVRQGGDILLGKEKDEDEEMYNRLARMFGTGGNATQGGMGVGG